MAIKLPDYTVEEADTVGTGDHQLTGPKGDFLGIGAKVGNGNKCLYIARSGTKEESCLGTVTTGIPDTITRDTIFESTNGGSAVNWLGGDAPIDVIVTPLGTVLQSLIDPQAADGILAQTAAQVYARRVITAGARVTVADGGGVAGNPTISVTLPATLAKTANYTVAVGDRDKLILGDATSGAFTVTLPAAATAGAGFEITVKKIDSSANIVTVDGDGSETIDGALTKSLVSQYDHLTLVSDGSNWHVKADFKQDVTLLETQTASASPQLDFITGINSKFPIFEFRITGLRPATNAVDLQMLVSEDGGSTFKVGAADYARHVQTIEAGGGGETIATDNSTSFMQWSGPSASGDRLGSDVKSSYSATIKMFNPSSAAHYKLFRAADIIYRDQNGVIRMGDGFGGYVGSINAIDAIRFKMSADDIAEGTISLFGVRK